MYSTYRYISLPPPASSPGLHHMSAYLGAWDGALKKAVAGIPQDTTALAYFRTYECLFRCTGGTCS